MNKGPVREWFDALIFAVIAATIIRWATFEAFTIPTPSMERTLLVGDFLFVNKLNYGPRSPMTPLQIPLTHQKICKYQDLLVDCFFEDQFLNKSYFNKILMHLNDSNI